MVDFAPAYTPAPALGALLVRERPAECDAYGAFEPDPPSSPLAIPEPETDVDALTDLGDEIATLAAHIHAATYRLLTLIAEFDQRRGWELDGHRSCAHWLAFRTGIDMGTAREKVRTARVLVGLPATGAAMSRGELSFSQVRALTRVATPANEADLVELARGSTTAQLERIVRGWKRGTKRDEAELERLRQDARTLSVFPDEDGMYQIRGKLTPEMGALLMRAVEAVSDQIWREHRIDALDTDKAAAQRRADALMLLIERAMSAGLSEVPVSGTRAERYQVVLHVDEPTLSADSEESSRSELEDGTRVSAETSRRLSCDAGLVCMTHACDGSILDVGRRMRTIPTALRRALEARDRGCRFPGCGLRFTDGHHITHWADGGETSLTNTLLLCRHHHTLVHEGGWKVDWRGEGRPVFHGPRGQVQCEHRWQPPELPDDVVSALVEENRSRGVEPDWRTASARWTRLEDVPDEVLFAAMEALG